MTVLPTLGLSIMSAGINRPLTTVMGFWVISSNREYRIVSLTYYPITQSDIPYTCCLALACELLIKCCNAIRSSGAKGIGTGGSPGACLPLFSGDERAK